MIVKGEKETEDDPGKQADNEKSRVTEETSQITEQENENADETISSTSTQDFDWETIEKEFINFTQHYQSISDSFSKLIKEVLHMKKRQLAMHKAGTPILPLVKVTTEEKISSMCGQRYTTGEAGTAETMSEEFDPNI